MQRLSPSPAVEPTLPSSPGVTVLHRFLYGVLVVLAAGGAYVGAGSSLPAMAPSLLGFSVMGPAMVAADAAAEPGRIKDLVEVALLPKGPEEEAIAAMDLPQADAAALLTQLRRRTVRLVRLPLFNAALLAPDDPASDDAAGPPLVEVTSAGFTRTIRLGHQPVTVTLPINRVGTVAFHALGRGAQIGAVTLNGPQQLPDLPAGAVLSVGVVAQ